MNASPFAVACRVALAGLAFAVARRRPAVRPVVWALLALAGLDAARALPLPGWADRVVWMAWPGVSAALAWAVWRRAWWVAAGPFLGYALGMALGSWEAYPEAWHVARWLPYLASPAMSLWAWWGRDARRGTIDPGPSRCAAILAWSGLCDVAVGALARQPYNLTAAHAVSAATWVAIVAVLLRR